MRGAAREGGEAYTAVANATLRVGAGEFVSVVGPTGCGKSTLGRLLLRLLEPTAGRVEFDGTDLASLGASGLRTMRRNMQIVFQDPYGALNPRMTIADSVGEPLDIQGGLTRAEREREGERANHEFLEAARH